MRRSTITVFTLGAIAVIFVIMGLVKGANASKLRSRCTESVPGVIIDVDSKLVRSGRSSHTEYCALVEYTIKGKNNSSTFTTDWTSARLEIGTQTVVHYDPNDPSEAYADKVQPEGAVPSFVTAGVLFVTGLIAFALNRAKGN